MAKRFLKYDEIVTYLKKHSYLPKEGIERFAKLMKNKVTISDIRLRMIANGWKWHLAIDEDFRESENLQGSIHFNDY